MEIIEISQAIQSLTDNRFTFTETDLDSIVWESNTKTKPTKSAIVEEIARLSVIEKNKLEAQAEARASALAKLAALGLTTDEIAAL